jgi:hypothetical protein
VEDVVQFARRLAGLLVAVALAAGLPLAAARAGCLCDHGHDHGAAASAKPHTCTAACTAATCPMHRRTAAGASHTGSGATRDGVRCSCSGDAQALIGQATTIAILPSLTLAAAPSSERPAALPPAVAAPSLQPSPPAPPPRA